MATVRIAINGFGRIGRLVFRAGLNNPQIEFVCINDLISPEAIAYLLKYDSTHGRFQGSIEAQDRGIVVNGKFIPCVSVKNPEELPWREHQVDYVVEATGLFTTHEEASKHLDAGAKRVVISAPTKDPDKVKTLVMGVNHHSFDPRQDAIVSNASCTTNCLAPIAKIIDDNFGLQEGLMTTIHAATATQSTVDGFNKKDLRLGRGTGQNIIPASTGAAKAVALVLPQLAGKLTGMAMRVPTPDVSAVDLTFRTAKATSYEEICQAMATAAIGEMQGILGYTSDPVVSCDFQGDARSSIFDAGAGMELNSNFFKVVAWYDNEWGYSNRAIELILSMAAQETVMLATA